MRARPLWLRWTLAIAALAWCVGRPLAQQRFQTTVDTVPIYATVVNAAGALVTDLHASDFEVEDDGKRQRIDVFKSDVQPITVAVLMDTSPSVFGNAAVTQTLVSEFTRRLLPDDRAIVGTFSHVVTLNTQFTNDIDLLLHRLGDDAPFPAGTALWDALEAGRTALAREPGRRIVVVVSDAIDNSSASDAAEVRTSLERDGVMVYGVGVRGRQGRQVREVTAIATATGGHYVELNAQDNAAAVAARIADELRRQYVLGFSPRTLDGKLHHVDVRVKRSGVSVRARRTYLAVANGPIR